MGNCTEPEAQNQAPPSSSLQAQNRQNVHRALSNDVSNVSGGTPPLPEGWQRVRDQRTGRYYYIDHINRQTHWELPASIRNGAAPRQARLARARTAQPAPQQITIPDAASAFPQDPPQQVRVWTNRNLGVNERNLAHINRLSAAQQMAQQEGVSVEAGAIVASFADKLIRRTSSAPSTGDRSEDIIRTTVNMLRESVMVRDQEVLIPRSLAYSCKMFEVVKPVKYRATPRFEEIGHHADGLHGPRVSSLVWARNVVTNFRNNGRHMEMIQTTGGWLPLNDEDGSSFLQPRATNMQSTLYEVVFEHGVALRCSSDFDERVTHGLKRSAARGDVLVIDALVTDNHTGTEMAFCSNLNGWLPISVKGQSVLSIADPDSMNFLNLRVLDPAGTVRWMSNKHIRPEQRRPDDPDAFVRPRDCPVHRMVWWVQRTDDGGQVWRIRSDDAQLALSLVPYKTLNDIATAPLELRRKWLRHELEQRQLSMHASVGPVKIWVRRECLLDDLIFAFSKLQDHDFNRQFLYAIKGETDFTLDVGGVSREVYLLAQQQLFAGDFGLFQESEGSNLSYMVNPNSSVCHENHLTLFKLAGQVFGKMMLDGMYINTHFIVPMYKFLLRLEPSMSDLQSVDEEVYSSLKWMMDNDIEDIIYETFSVETEGAFGEKEVHELCPGGAQIEVTNENKLEYIKQRLSYTLCTRVEQQRVAFSSGLFSVVPPELLSVFSYRELELLACGVSSIDVDDWEANTVYRSTNPKNQTVKWFWEVVRQFSDEQRCKLLQFTTGTTNLPVEGFKGLQSARGVSRLFQITLVPTTNGGVGPTSPLPHAHTCFNTIDLPAFPTKEEMKNVLSMVIELEATGFEMDE